MCALLPLRQPIVRFGSGRRAQEVLRRVATWIRQCRDRQVRDRWSVRCIEEHCERVNFAPEPLGYG
jgi:hypothetical protein